LPVLQRGKTHINADLHVIPMRKLAPQLFFRKHRTEMDSAVAKPAHSESSLLYPGLEILQNAAVSVGRGTEAPFEEFGRPGSTAGKSRRRSTQRIFPASTSRINRSFPSAGLYAGRIAALSACGFTVRAALRSGVGLESPPRLARKYPDHFDITKIVFLVGNDSTIPAAAFGTPGERNHLQLGQGSRRLRRHPPPLLPLQMNVV